MNRRFGFTGVIKMLYRYRMNFPVYTVCFFCLTGNGEGPETVFSICRDKWNLSRCENFT
jgi:hypothetical protein